MNYLSGVLVLLLINVAAGEMAVENENDNQLDFCLLDLTSNLDGRTYPIDDLFQMVGTVFKEEFESLLNDKGFKQKFLDKFGSGPQLEPVKIWYYDFEQLGRIDVHRILPESLHCLFVHERESFPYPYLATTLETNSIIKYLVHHVFDVAMEEDLTNVRLPLIVFNHYNVLACNFGKMVSANKEFFVLHCVHNIMDDGTGLTTKIMQKSSQLHMCYSSVPEICEYDFDVDLRSKFDMYQQH